MVSIALGFAIILLLLNMLRRSKGEGIAPLNDQQFLDFFYNELTLSNFKNIIKSESDAIRYCTLAGILPSIDSQPPHCPTHINSIMKTSKCIKNKLGFCYVCTEQNCKKSISPLKRTWFENSHITFTQGLHIILCYLAGLKHKQAVIELKIDKNTVTNWFSYLREVQMIVVSQPRKIGGIYETEFEEEGNELGEKLKKRKVKQIVSDFVEVDESQIYHRKYNRGRLYNTESQRLWIVGGVCRRTRQAFMVRVPNRKINVIDYLLETRIELGSILVTDCARVYTNVKNRLGIDHYSVNHKLHFVDPNNSEINTNMIESRWAAMKNRIKSYKNTNFVESCIAQHLYEFEFLYDLKEKFSYGKVFQKLVSDIVRIYPGPNDNIAPLELVKDDWDRIVDW
jgi:hypothetical protein